MPPRIPALRAVKSLDNFLEFGPGAAHFEKYRPVVCGRSMSSALAGGIPHGAGFSGNAYPVIKHYPSVPRAATAFII
jgi:hypothetical protein